MRCSRFHHWTGLDRPFARRRASCRAICCQCKAFYSTFQYFTYMHRFYTKTNTHASCSVSSALAMVPTELRLYKHVQTMKTLRNMFSNFSEFRHASRSNASCSDSSASMFSVASKIRKTTATGTMWVRFPISLQELLFQPLDVSNVRHS